MDYHESNILGKFWTERVATLPTWTTADKGRIVYAIDVDKFYTGGDTGWETLESELTRWAGYSIPSNFEYYSRTAVYINPCRYHIQDNFGNERLVKTLSGFIYNFGSGGDNSNSDDLNTSDWHYLYLDWSSIDATYDDFGYLHSYNLINSKEEPAWSSTKNGWYGQGFTNVTAEDRCICAFRTRSSAAQLEKFWMLDDRCIRWADYYQNFAIVAHQTWPTTWTNKATYCPSFSNMIMVITDPHQSVKTKSQFFYWRPPNSTSQFLLARYYYDVSGDNQGDHRVTNYVDYVVVNDSKELAVLGTSQYCALYQKGYYLPNGM
jgi:hypothetical protein